VMGCVVNGPGEGQHADIGIAGGKNKGILFKHGKIVGTFPEKELVPALLRELDIIAREDAEKLAS
jgi:(E)-4-hydroxy-3-methylbut-2-enyl-diphosphate synthase